jgi:hypothetical protein
MTEEEIAQLWTDLLHEHEMCDISLVNVPGHALYAIGLTKPLQELTPASMEIYCLAIKESLKGKKAVCGKIIVHLDTNMVDLQVFVSRPLTM